MHAPNTTHHHATQHQQLRAAADLDMTQQMVQPVLRLCLAPISSHAPVCHCNLLNWPLLDWQATQQDKSPAIHSLIPELHELGTQLWKGESLLCDIL